MRKHELALGVTRSRECHPSATLDSCHAIMFSFRSEGSETDSHLCVWRDGVKNIKPVDDGKRLRDLRPGDAVQVFGQPAVLTAVEIYR